MLLELRKIVFEYFSRPKLENVLEKALSKKFIFEKMMINDHQIKLKTITFAKNFAYANGDKITAYRVLERSDKPSWESTKVIVELPRKVHSFDRGEDPRLFLFNGQNWIMIQTFIPSAKDVEITVYNLDTDQSYILTSPLGFNGKNWVPYEFDSNLYFIYSLEPFIVMKATFIEENIVLTTEKYEKEFKPQWEHDPIHSIGWVRGGTPALMVQSKKYYVGFSHAINNNSDIHSHTFGIYLFNPQTFCIQKKPLSRYVPNLLLDPYGLRILDNLCEIDLSVGIFDIHIPDSVVANITFSSNILDIINQNFNAEELRAVE